MIRLLTDPDGFFRESAPERGLRGPALVVLLAGVTNTVPVLVLIQRLLGSLSTAFRILAIGMLFISAVAGVFAVFFMWYGFASVFHAISTLFGGVGELRTTIRYVGWGFVPIVLSGLISLGFLLVTLPDQATFGDPGRVEQIARATQHSQLALVSSVVTSTFTVWSGLIWAFALVHARELDLRSAAITVGAPVTLLLAYTAYTTV